MLPAAAAQRPRAMPLLQPVALPILTTALPLVMLVELRYCRDMLPTLADRPALLPVAQVTIGNGPLPEVTAPFSTRRLAAAAANGI